MSACSGTEVPEPRIPEPEPQVVQTTPEEPTEPEEPVEVPKPTLQFDMGVSEDLRASIVPLEKARYVEADLGPLFGALREKGDAYCRVLDGDEEDPGHTKAHAFVPEKRREYFKAMCRKCKTNVKLGCWNFFRMNDKAPEQDFELVKQLWPADSYDCYSVGMVQPYMMHDIMNCSTLTTVDFDWRIQDAHQQLVQKYREGGIVDQASLETALKDVTIGWIAFFGTARPSHPASLDAFCPKRQREACVEHLVGFQSKYDQLEGFHLELAALHDANFLRTETTKVVYLSNAIESIYTSEDEFKQMLGNLTNALAVGQSAVLIHHVGGYPNFGLYEVKKTESGVAVSTRCRDRYVATAENRTAPTYETWVDGASSTTGPIPTCKSLFAEPETP